MTRPAANFSTLIAQAAMLPPLKTVVVCPEDRNSLGGVILSAERGLIEPILVGNVSRILAPPPPRRSKWCSPAARGQL